jgi:predicted transcriptional regulator
MSIHPRYAEAILNGSKQVEFRKRRIADDVTHVVVYATAPVSAVVGAFAVNGQHTSSPPSLWRRFRRVGGISRDLFFDYFAGREQGTGIHVGAVLAPAEPLPLLDSVGVARPPQSYQYLPSETAGRVLAGMTRVAHGS